MGRSIDHLKSRRIVYRSPETAPFAVPGQVFRATTTGWTKRLCGNGECVNHDSGGRPLGNGPFGGADKQRGAVPGDTASRRGRNLLLNSSSDVSPEGTAQIVVAQPYDQAPRV